MGVGIAEYYTRGRTTGACVGKGGARCRKAGASLREFTAEGNRRRKRFPRKVVALEYANRLHLTSCPETNPPPAETNPPPAGTNPPPAETNPPPAMALREGKRDESLAKFRQRRIFLIYGVPIAFRADRTGATTRT